MSDLRLEDLIADLSDDGVLESSGSFTLDPEKAEEKLRNFALPSPHDYILKIIQCAVASGSPVIRIKSQPGKLEITFTGEPIVSSDLTGLMGHLLQQETVPRFRRFRHLAAGMRGAMAVSPKAISFEGFDGQTGFRRIWDKEGWRQEVLSNETGQPFHRFTLSRSLSQTLSSAGEELKSVFQPEGEDYTTEELRIVKACLYSPAQIFLDGKPLAQASFGTARYPGYEISKDPNPGESRPPHYIGTALLVDGLMDGDHHLVEACYPAEGVLGSLLNPSSEATIRLETQPGTEQRCTAWLAISAKFAPPELTYVEDGVTLCTTAPGISCPGFRGVISAETLNKDLTGFQLVKDRTFQEHTTWIWGQIHKLRSKVLDSMALYPNRERIQKELKTVNLDVEFES
jgi:hypothetical protein